MRTIVTSIFLSFVLVAGCSQEATLVEDETDETSDAGLAPDTGGKDAKAPPHDTGVDAKLDAHLDAPIDANGNDADDIQEAGSDASASVDASDGGADASDGGDAGKDAGKDASKDATSISDATTSDAIAVDEI